MSLSGIVLNSASTTEIFLHLVENPSKKKCYLSAACCDAYLFAVSIDSKYRTVPSGWVVM